MFFSSFLVCTVASLIKKYDFFAFLSSEGIFVATPDVKQGGGFRI